MKAIAKMTMKNLLGGKVTKPTERVMIAAIYGQVMTVTTKPSRFDPTQMEHAFGGVFEAKCSNGEELTSATFYPPKSLGELLNARGIGAEFAVRVFIEPSATSATGYSYDYESAIEQRTDERLAALRAGALGLPAPTAETTAKGKKA